MSRRHKRASTPPPRSSAPRAAPGRFFAITIVIALVVAGGVWVWRGRQPAGNAPNAKGGRPPSDMFHAPPDAEAFAAYAGSKSCRDCHAQAYQKWSESHHGLAERSVEPRLDQPAFEPTRSIPHGQQRSEARLQDGRFELNTMGLDRRPATFAAERVIGVDPLRQFLFAAPGGRWQAGELAFDPHRAEWFDVYGEEDRVGGEWGHWTGRGMTWNSMCASCHNTRLRKNYDVATDSYATAMAERSVGCEACHGPMQKHVAWQRAHGGWPDPTQPRLDKSRMLDTCGSCHARRGELTGDFTPGQDFFDHYSLVIPDATDLFYADGQVREEDYEFTSFLSSRMHAAGVRCMDCHDPHSGKNLIAGDALCMRCHTTPVPPAPAPKIDAATHSHHAPGTPGGRCVDCHMPLTTYMQRHPRRDHGFTIPDPLLTKEHQIPNACSRCHTNQTVDWAIEAVDRWYGPRMNRPTRTRARTIAEARAGHTNAPFNLMRVLAAEQTPLWRASAARLLRSWNMDPAVSRALIHAAGDPDPQVRAGVAHAFDGSPRNSAGLAVVRSMLTDSKRSVRVAAAWSSRASLDTNALAAHDLLLSLRQSDDQPAGQHLMGIWHFDRGETTAAVTCLRRAVEWDGNSPPLRHTLAVALSAQNQSAAAVEQLEAACRLAPREAEYRYQLALALNEAGRLADATAALEETVKIDPRLALGWYNLGLAYSTANDPARALDALIRAESLQPGDPRAPYARATILARLGRKTEARAAAERALEIHPDFPDAAQLLRVLDRAP